MREVFSVTSPVWLGRMGWCTAALSVAMATSEYSRQRGPKGPDFESSITDSSKAQNRLNAHEYEGRAEEEVG